MRPQHHTVSARMKADNAAAHVFIICYGTLTRGENGAKWHACSKGHFWHFVQETCLLLWAPCRSQNTWHTFATMRSAGITIVSSTHMAIIIHRMAVADTLLGECSPLVWYNPWKMFCSAVRIRSFIARTHWANRIHNKSILWCHWIRVEEMPTSDCSVCLESWAGVVYQLRSCLLFKPYFVVQVLFKTMSVVLLFMNNRQNNRSLLLERSDALTPTASLPLSPTSFTKIHNYIILYHYWLYFIA